VIAAGRIVAVPIVQAVGEIGRIDEPGGAAVLADKLARDVDEVGLLPEVVHVHNEFPGSRNHAKLGFPSGYGLGLCSTNSGEERLSCGWSPPLPDSKVEL
jgi:hypothetical protein